MDKKKVKEELIRHIDSCLLKLQQDLDQLNQAKANETKSSAGDKYETSRAMIQQEMDQFQLKISQWNMHLLKISNLAIRYSHIVEEGSLIKTDRGIYYFSTSVGKFKFQDEIIFALSIDAPIYEQLKGKEEGSIINFNGQQFKILTVC